MNQPPIKQEFKKLKKKPKDETQSFQPKTLMEKHPIEVNPSDVIATPPGKTVINPIEDEATQRKKKKKRTCDTCNDGCNCSGWDSKVGDSEERYIF